jgi:hypothetical protein
LVADGALHFGVKRDPEDRARGCAVDRVINNPYVQGTTKVAVRTGLVTTAAVGDAPGSVAGTLLLANTVLGGTAAAVSGTTQIIGAATQTNTKEAEEVLSVTSSLPGLATAAVTGGNMKAAHTVTTITSGFTLAAAPREAVKNVATAADALKQ